MAERQLQPVQDFQNVSSPGPWGLFAPPSRKTSVWIIGAFGLVSKIGRHPRTGPILQAVLHAVNVGPTRSLESRTDPVTMPPVPL